MCDCNYFFINLIDNNARDQYMETLIKIRCDCKCIVRSSRHEFACGPNGVPGEVTCVLLMPMCCKVCPINVAQPVPETHTCKRWSKKSDQKSKHNLYKKTWHALKMYISKNLSIIDLVSVSKWNLMCKIVILERGFLFTFCFLFLSLYINIVLPIIFPKIWSYFEIEF